MYTTRIAYQWDQLSRQQVQPVTDFVFHPALLTLLPPHPDPQAVMACSETITCSTTSSFHTYTNTDCSPPPALSASQASASNTARPLATQHGRTPSLRPPSMTVRCRRGQRRRARELLSSGVSSRWSMASPEPVGASPIPQQSRSTPRSFLPRMAPPPPNGNRHLRIKMATSSQIRKGGRCTRRRSIRQ